MKNILAALVLSLSMAACVITPYGYDEVVYEPDVVVGAYYVGYYDPAFGYWTGSGWDVNFYVYGHAGYGHYYRGAPRSARGYYHGGGHVARGRATHPVRHF